MKIAESITHEALSELEIEINNKDIMNIIKSLKYKKENQT